MERLNDEQAAFVNNCFKRWLEIREQFPGSFQKESARDSLSDAAQLRADIDHSALLRRLLGGKEPFPSPPPKSNGSPWYDLLDNGSAEASVILESYSDRRWLAVDGDSGWEILHKQGNEYEVQYRPGGYRARVHPTQVSRIRMVDGVQQEFLSDALLVELE